MKIGIVQKRLIAPRTDAANATVDISAVFNGIKWVAPPTFYVKQVKNAGNNCTLSLQVSFDEGTTKKQCLAFTEATTGTTTQLKTPGGNGANEALPWADKVYAVYTTSTSGNYTWELWAAGPAMGGAGF